MSNLQYFNLSIPAPKRLQMMRKDFAGHAAKYPNCPEYYKPKTWRDVRAYTLGSYRAAFGAGLNPGFNGEGYSRSPVWYSHTGPQFRGESLTDTGFYTEHDGTTRRDGSGLAHGLIARLSHGRYIAGYHWGDNGERVYFPEVFTDEEDATQMANEHARVFAEMCQEDSAAREEARELEEKNEDAFSRLRECLALRNRPCFAHLREEARELIEAIRETRETLKNEFADYA